MAQQIQIATKDRSLRTRLGGRWAISRAPYFWSAPVVILLTPFATVSPTTDPALFTDLVIFAVFGWVSFGAVLALGHYTYFRNRATHSVAPIATIILGALAGLARSLASGDWFEIAHTFGLHSPALVAESVLSGIAWIVLTAAFMESKHSFNDARDVLIAEQAHLLTSSEQWLLDVRKQRFALADSLRDQIRQDWHATREAILIRLNDSSKNWHTVVDELTLASEETVSSLTSTLTVHTRRQTSVRDAFALIATTPILEIRNTALFITFIGIIPVAHVTNLVTSIFVMAGVNFLFFVIGWLSRKAVHAWPEQSFVIYWLTSVAIGTSTLMFVPALVSTGMSMSVSIASAVLGAVILVLSFTGFNVIKLNSLVKDKQLTSLQTQNLLLESLEQARSQQEHEARIDLVSYFITTIRNSVMAAKNLIEEGIASGDAAAVNSGLAVIDAVYSSILSRYTSEDSIDIRAELTEIVAPWSNKAIITWNLDEVNFQRETNRRVLLVIAECVTHLMAHELALRIHIDVTGNEGNAQLRLEANTSKDWVQDALLTRDVLDASTRSNWSISGTLSNSTIVANFGN